MNPSQMATAGVQHATRSLTYRPWRVWVNEIASGSPAGEYEPEVSTILPRLREAAGPDDALRIVNEEFEKWFGQPASDAEELGREIWSAWQRYLADTTPAALPADPETK